ncbi:decapping and exoribonuclease protein-like [Phymastichus coffea]|uniref:decapping and exoribonuclease protein-like n=1 Tax=Phymastichus coffea TaxID=108790 RepID=UPI00273BE3B3|nr:decapping and exoribonuclease protein-like [Phymastichus coffea]
MSFYITTFNTNQSFPSFNRPEILGYYSLNEQERLYSEDLSQLKYYNERKKKKKVQFNLNEGIDCVIRKLNDKDERIDHICRWIINNYAKILAEPEEQRWLRPEFICYRGLLTKICSTPFEERDGWIICAAKFHGNIYLCAFETEQQKIKNSKLTSRDLKFMSWGFKFEQFLLSDSPNTAPCTSQPVNESEEFNCVMKTKLGQNMLLYGAEMDGAISTDIIEEPVDWKHVKFVELKTNMMIKTKWQRQFYKKKLLKWWCQNFLVGIEQIVCGTRTNSGLVFEIDTINVSDMPKIAKNLWSASESMNFCNRFLNHLKNVVTEDCSKCIYKFEFKLNRNIEMQILPALSNFSFLSNWYKEEVEKIRKAN